MNVTAVSGSLVMNRLEEREIIESPPRLRLKGGEGGVGGPLKNGITL